MGFFSMFLVSLAFMVIGELLRPKPKIDKPKPSALGDFQFPTAEPTRVIPVFCGTCKFSAPNTPYFGDLEIKKIKKKVKTGLFSSETIIQGYKYFLTVQLTWAWGFVDEFVRLEADDTPVKIKNFVATADYWAFDMDDPTHMSDDEPENGLTGHVVLYRGSTTQPVNAKLQALWAEDQTSPFLMLCHMVMEHCYLGNSDTPPAFALVMARYPNSLGMTGGHHAFDGDSNPACWCYELMTNRIWGRKMDPTRIDTASFIACGETLYNERMGVSMQLDNGVPLRETLAEILRHIDGVIYPDPATGKYTMALARDDYDVEDLDELNDSDISDEDFEFSRQSWDETKNVVTATFTDRAHNFQQRPAQYKDLANINARFGQIDPENIDFLAFSNAANAQKAVARAGKTLSSPLVRASFYTNRKAWDYRPGKVFKMTKAAFGITGLVARVIDINYGTLDEPRIRLTIAEDIFAVSALAYNEPPPSEWESPIGAGVAVATQALFEIPYHLIGAEERRVASVAAPTALTDLGYEAWQDPAGGSAYTFGMKVPAFTPTGVLVNAFPVGNAVDAGGFLVTGDYGMEDITSTTTDGMYAGVNLALIRSSAGDEMVSWRAVATESGNWRITDVLRGALDTIPLSHPAGGRVWFYSEGVGQLRDTAYTTNSTITAKLLPYNFNGTLPIASAAGLSQLIAQRAWKPYPAANIKIDGSTSAAVIFTDATVTWAIRHRLQQYTDTKVVAQNAASYVAAPEGFYRLKVYVNGVLKRTADVTVAPFDTFAYTTAMRIADDADLTRTVQVGITDINGAYSSIERMSHVFYMADANPLEITTTTAPDAIIGTPYSLTLTAIKGIPPYTWSHTGTLPAGLSRTGAVISGTATTPGASPLTLAVQDALGVTDTQALTIIATTAVTDPYYSMVKALLFFNNNLTDEIPGHVWDVVNSGLSYDAVNKIEGSHSLALSGAFIEEIDATNFPPGTGDFTYEGFVRAGAVSNSGLFTTRRDNSHLGVGLGWYAGAWQLSYGGGSAATYSFAWDGSYRHWFVQRIAGVIYVGSGYVSAGTGVVHGSQAAATNFTDTGLSVGTYYGPSNPWAGNLDGFRYTKGIGRYPTSGAYTLPTSFPAYDPYFANVAALLHMDGANGSTTFTDVTGKAWTAVGSAQLSNTGYKFGGACGLFDGDSDYVYSPVHADFGFGTGDYTVEGFFNPSASNTGNRFLADFRGAAGASFVIWCSQSGVYDCLGWSTEGGVGFVSAGGVWTVGTPKHWAVTREAGTVRGFVNGALVFTTTDSRGYASPQGVLIGSSATANQGALGRLDEVRITKGVARYTAAFSPPSLAFPDS